MKHRTLSQDTKRRLSQPRRGGFTLIELTVVLAIAAVVTAITVGSFNSLGDGHRRVTCQTNLTLIYQAARLYAADESGNFPYYNPDPATPAGERGIGLWQLYTFPANKQDPTASGDDIAIDVLQLPASAPSPTPTPVPVERYLRNIKVLHCPNDIMANHEQVYASPNTGQFNREYLSYQMLDDNETPPPIDTVDRWTYSSIRTKTVTDPDWKRQLLHLNGTSLVVRPPSDDTVVVWCKHHRKGSGGRDYDNVLFYDGSVKFLPRDQSGSGLIGWQRKPVYP